MKYTAGWLLIVAAFALLEVIALLDPGVGDTFSEHIWQLVDEYPWLVLPGLAGLGWTAYHFFFQKRS